MDINEIKSDKNIDYIATTISKVISNLDSDEAEEFTILYLKSLRNGMVAVGIGDDALPLEDFEEKIVNKLHKLDSRIVP